MRHCSKLYRLGGLLAGAAWLGGCSGFDLGDEVRVPLARQHTLGPDEIAAGPIHLPAGRGFNIHVPQSSRQPGADGRADSDSEASADGQAFCRAEVSNGGSAWADFKIGHRLVNRSGSPQSVRIQLEYQLEQSIEASPVPTAGTLATAHMDLVVVDSQKQNLAKMVVVHATSDEARAAASSQDQRTLTVRFEPGRWYDIMLLGRADAAADAGQQALARLDVRQLKMRLSLSPAATQPAPE